MRDGCTRFARLNMRTSAKSGLFLIEMIIAIMFFAICCAICTSLFVRAHVISQRTRNANMAVTVAQSAAECFKAADGSPQETAQLLEADYRGGEINLFYDKDWQRTSNIGSAYRISVYVGGEDYALRDVMVVVIDNREGSVIYDLEAKKYVPRKEAKSYESQLPERP